jgi:hypothetical protein
MIDQGCVILGCSPNAHLWDHSKAVNGSNTFDAFVLIIFGEGLCGTWSSIGDAITAVEATKERWYEAEVNRIAGSHSSRRRLIQPAR